MPGVFYIARMMTISEPKVNGRRDFTLTVQDLAYNNSGPEVQGTLLPSYRRHLIKSITIRHWQTIGVLIEPYIYTTPTAADLSLVCDALDPFVTIEANDTTRYDDLSILLVDFGGTPKTFLMTNSTGWAVTDDLIVTISGECW